MVADEKRGWRNFCAPACSGLAWALCVLLSFSAPPANGCCGWTDCKNPSVPGTLANLIAAHLRIPGAEDEVSFVIEDNPGQAEVWVHAKSDSSVSVRLPRPLDGAASVVWDLGASNQVPVRQGAFALNVGFRPDQSRSAPPPELAGKAPRDWPGNKPAIGVVNLPGMPRSWTSITPNDWLQGFATSRGMFWQPAAASARVSA